MHWLYFSIKLFKLIKKISEKLETCTEDAEIQTTIQTKIVQKKAINQ